MINHNVNNKKQVEKGKERLNSVLTNLEDVNDALDQSAIVAITNQRGTILYANKKFCEVSKYSKEELIGEDHRILNSNYHPHSFFKNMWKTIGTGNTWRGEIRNKAKDGTFYWVDTTIVPFLNEKGKPYQYVSIRYDISRLKKAEADIRKGKEKYRLITENSADLISKIDENGHFLYASPSFKYVLGYELDYLHASDLYEFVHTEDRDDLYDSIQDIAMTSKKATQLQFRLQKKDDSYIYVEATVNPIEGIEDERKKLVLSMRDITERKKNEQTIYHLAYHDVLTELPNRRFFMDYLRKEVYKASRSNSSLAVMYVDVDRFKYFNDSFGHEVGDLILSKTAERINKCLEKGDIVARLGGDEFTILMKDAANIADVERVAHRIRNEVKLPLSIEREAQSLSCSIGIAMYPQDGADADELLKRADIALYNVKERGRDGVKFFHLEMEKRALDRILLENELKKAIEQEQFVLEYQPKIALDTEQIIGMEALVRWDHPELGRIGPHKFIPLAEETGLILPLGEWIIRKGCMQNKKWQMMGFPPLKLSINVSSRQFYHPELAKKIKSILQETGLDAKWLELEITESVLANLEAAVQVLKQIKTLGVQVSIDDFGTGYSSLSYIKQLPIDTLKIDASFIQDIHENKESKAIVEAIVTIAETLNLKVVAEGVESKDQMESLCKEKNIHGQGYYFSKPLSTSQFEQYMEKKTR